MKYNILWETPPSNIVDLEDFGHEESKIWDDLNEDERCEILDALRSEQVNIVKDTREI